MTIMTRFKNIISANMGSLFIFLIVGGLTAGFYVSFFTLLWKMLHLNYQVAISISYIVSVILYFFANKKFTFKNSGNTMAQQVPRYLFLLLINYLVTLTVMHITVELLSFPPYIGIFAAIGITCMLSYSLSRLWIFKVI